MSFMLLYDFLVTVFYDFLVVYEYSYIGKFKFLGGGGGAGGGGGILTILILFNISRSKVNQEMESGQ